MIYSTNLVFLLGSSLPSVRIQSTQQDDSCPHHPTEMEVATAQVPVIAAPPAPTCHTCPEIATTVKKKNHSGIGCSAHYALGRPLDSKKSDLACP